MFEIRYSLIYLAMISAISVIVTVYDKLAATKRGKRISEQALLCLSAVGGSFAMMIAMIIISHKTNKVKFMVGIPLIIVVQIVFTLFVLNYVI